MIYLCLTTQPYTYSKPVLCGKTFLEAEDISLLSIAYHDNNFPYKKNYLVTELVYKIYKEI